jgi:DNA-binding transcriptional MerR regulator
VRLKALYTSREVAALTGLTARQLQWWHARRIFVPTQAPHPTAAGGFTERRYTPVELLELMVLADLRRRGFSVASLRRLLDVLRSRFKVRLFEAIEGGGPIALFVDGTHIFARTESGELYNVLENPRQPLLMVGEGVKLRPLAVREPRGRKPKVTTSSSESGRSSRGRRRGVG